MKVSSSWRLQRTETTRDNDSFVKFIIRSSCPTEGDVTKIKPIQVVNNNSLRRKGVDSQQRSFHVFMPPRICSTLLSLPNKKKHNNGVPPLRIILAIHGYGARPMQEIKKWHNVAISLNAIILAPQGTLTTENRGGGKKEEKLGWNAIHCCGDPVTNEIDDIDFITNGVVEMFLNALGGQTMMTNPNGAWLQQQRANVIATGFSNGAFMSSLMGLQSANARPSWLVGIVPISGYQYDIELYNGNPANDDPGPHPLPMMAHHGGRDKVVNHNGCCLVDNSKSESNCQFGIGNKQDSCTSAKSAFDMWSLINGCSSTILDSEIVVQSLSVDKEDDLYTCWKGQDCIEPTNFCLWNKEGHNPQFPGIEMTQTWIENVFRHAELQSNNIVEDHLANSEHDDELNIAYAAAISFYESHPKEGRRVYASIILSALVLLLCMYKMQRIKACLLYYKQRKKTEIERR